ncbi:MAG: ribonuclease HII [Bacteroidales bacterium]|nr:ribonuclease HII [Bacteroidales bacterium]
MVVKQYCLKPYHTQGITEAGCDEAGRGCLAGPVFAAAVVLPQDYSHTVLNDSKKLSEKVRYALREEIIKTAISWAVDYVLPDEIDRSNILKASIAAMHRAIDKLNITPGLLLIDGNRFIKYKNIEHRCIIKGDATFYSIAAASVLAKTFRDDYMLKIHNDFKHYAWNKNKGYPTDDHRRAIAKFGITPHHRKSFKLTDSQLKFEFQT